MISRGHYHWQHEPCWYAVRKGKGANWCGDRSQKTLWSAEHQISDTDQGDQLVIPGFETTAASRAESIKVQMTETLEKRAAAIRTKDWDCAQLLLDEYRRLEAMLERQDDLFNPPMED